jgi:hypothetical protein
MHYSLFAKIESIGLSFLSRGTLLSPKFVVVGIASAVTCLIGFEVLVLYSDVIEGHAILVHLISLCELFSKVLFSPLDFSFHGTHVELIF